MKKKNLWIFALAAMMCFSFVLFMVGCTDDTLPPLESLTITNEDALTEEWYVGDEDRTVEVAYSPDSYTQENTETVVTSSNTSAVSVSGMTLHAVAPGTAAITVSVGEVSDTVSVTVSPTVESISIDNKDALTVEWILGAAVRTVEVTYSPSSVTQEDVPPVVTSSDEEVIEADGLTLRAVGVGTAMITVSAGGKQDSVAITTSVTAPVLTVDGFEDDSDVFQMVTNETTELPAISALACDGIDLSDYVEITVSDTDRMTVSRLGRLSVSEKGTYEITFTVADPRDNSKTASQTIDVEVYRKVFGLSLAFTEENEFAADEEQTARLTSDLTVYAEYNVTPSKLYYAEAIYRFDGAMPNESNKVGMGHFVQGDPSRYIHSSITRHTVGNQQYKLLDYQTNDTLWEGDANADYYDLNLSLYSHILPTDRGIEDNDQRYVKYATARIGDYFYFFINDQYVNSVSFEYYRDKDTVPGLVARNGPGALDNITVNISGMMIWQGQEAQAKVDELLAQDEGGFITTFGNAWANLPIAGFDAAVARQPETAGRGIAFNYVVSDKTYNDSCPSPQIYFEGDFTFSWEYKHTNAAENPSESPRMLLDVMTWRFAMANVSLGASFTDGGNSYQFTGGGTTEEHSFTDDSEGSRYTLTRVLKDDHAEYTLTVINLATGEKYTRTVNLSDFRWDEPVLLVWRNVYLAGEYSNITWSVDEADIQAALDMAAVEGYMVDSVSISNKEALQAAWLVGGADRTVEFTYSPASLPQNLVVASVTSSDPDIIAVEGTTLKAVGIGTATVTLSAGGKQDTVTIEVTTESAEVDVTLGFAEANNANGMSVRLVGTDSQIYTAMVEDNAAAFAGVPSGVYTLEANIANYWAKVGRVSVYEGMTAPALDLAPLFEGGNVFFDGNFNNLPTSAIDTSANTYTEYYNAVQADIAEDAWFSMKITLAAGFNLGGTNYGVGYRFMVGGEEYNLMLVWKNKDASFYFRLTKAGSIGENADGVIIPEKYNHLINADLEDGVQLVPAEELTGLYLIVNYNKAESVFDIYLAMSDKSEVYYLTEVETNGGDITQFGTALWFMKKVAGTTTITELRYGQTMDEALNIVEQTA